MQLNDNDRAFVVYKHQVYAVTVCMTDNYDGHYYNIKLYRVRDPGKRFCVLHY